MARTIDALTLTMSVTVRRRADVHGWRLEPEAFPRSGAPRNVLTGSVHSHAAFSASGSISRYDSGTRTTITWSGSGGPGNQVGAFAIDFGGTVYRDSRRVETVQLGVAGGGTQTQLTVTEQFDVNAALPVTLSPSGQSPAGDRSRWPSTTSGTCAQAVSTCWRWTATSCPRRRGAWCARA